MQNSQNIEDRRAYKALYDNGKKDGIDYILQIFPNKKPLYSNEDLKTIALKYANRQDFKNKNPKPYAVALHRLGAKTIDDWFMKKGG